MPLLPSLHMCANSEITQIDVALNIHQNVTRFDISVYLSLAVEIVESVHHLQQNGGYEHLVLDPILTPLFNYIVYGTGCI